MPTNFPGSLDTLANPTATNTMDGVPHHTQHASANDAIEAIEAKVGTGASTAVVGTVLTGTGTGTSAWNVPAATDLLGSVVYKASGGDDAAPLRTLIASLPNGSIIYLPDAQYLFSTVNAAGVFVDISTSNVFFVGRGRERLDSGDPTGHGYTTIIKATIAGEMFRWRPTMASAVNGADQVDQVQGGGIQGCSLAGNSNATVCIDVTGGCRGQRFTDLWIGGSTVKAVWASPGASHTGVHHTWHSTSEVVFRDCVIRGTGSVHGAVLDGNANANGGENSYQWEFYNCTFITTNGTGLQINDSDDCYAFGCGFVVAGTGHSFDLTGSSGKPNARACTFSNCYGGTFATTGIARATGLTRAARSNLMLGMGTEDATGYPTIEPGAGLYWIDDWGRHTLRPDIRSSSTITDDFNGGLLTDGVIGETGWHLVGAGATVTYVAASAFHPGVRQLNNGAGAAVLCAVVQSGQTNTGLTPSVGFESSFIFRLNAAGSDGDVMCRVGWGNAYNGDPPADGFWLEKLAGDTTWWFVCSNSSTKTRTNSAVTVVNAGWVRLCIRRRNDTQIGMSISDIVDGVDDAVISTNVPTVGLSAMFQIKNATAVTKTMDIDAFQFSAIGMSR